MGYENGYEALLGELYAGARDQNRMRGFLRGLGDLTKSHVTSFLREDFTNSAAFTFLTVGADRDEVSRYSDYAGDNIWIGRCMPDLRTGAVCNGDDYVSQTELKSSRYYDGFLRHIDTQHSVGICAAFEKTRGAFLTLCRSAGAGAYDPECLGLLRRAAPHVVNAFALTVQFEHLQAQADQATARRRAIFLLDPHWRWVGGNPVAEEFVAAGWWRGRLNTRLEACHPITSHAWQFLQCQMRQGAAAQRVIPVHNRKGELVAFASVHGYSSHAGDEYAPCYTLFVRPLHPTDMRVVPGQLRQLFRLTPSECALALALRKHGDLARAAAAIGITESSAGTRVQSVFEKIGIHRQSDLALLIDALAETMA